MAVFRFYAPLAEFRWEGKSFELADGVVISDSVVLPDLGGTAKQLAEPEWQRTKNARHWLTFVIEEGSPTRPHEVSNLVLLALWIANPTRTCIEFSFEGSDDGRHKKTGRNLSRFSYIAGKQFADFTDDLLETVWKQVEVCVWA